MYLCIYGVLGLGQAVSVFVSSIVLYLGTLNGANILHNVLLFNTIRGSSNLFFDITPAGRIMNTFSKDVDALDSVLPENMKSLLTTSLSVLATLFVISFNTPIFIICAIPLGIIYYIVQRLYIASSRQLKRLQSMSRAPIYSHFSESLAGTSSIRAYGLEDKFICENEQKVYENQRCHYPNIISNRWLGVRLEMIGNLVIFFAAILAVRQEKPNASLVGLSITYALQITQHLNWLVRMMCDLETNIVSVERIKEYGDLPQEASWEDPKMTPSPDWPENGSIEFNNCWVRYRPNLKPVLKGLSISIKGGEKIGVVGRTGEGKSSFALTLFRIVELEDGKIIVDDIDIATLGLYDLRSRLTIIPQDPVLFSGTLRMNLDPYNKYTDKEIWKAVENAHMKCFIKSLDSDLYYKLQEGGKNFSVGQRQLICLARALLRRSKVLILDEATASVDLKTDDLIQKTIKTKFQNCTIIKIAHRLNTIMDSNRILVLEGGSVVDFDTPSALLSNKNSIFYNMARHSGLVK
ncbi:multidrug resistance-associated protein 1-like isoform X2 [Agrilus planipennis]|nr:multidrug resistance-associated protein 1-like isoform X2 [Agrilus planipennis]